MRHTNSDAGALSVVIRAVPRTKSLVCESRLALLLHPWYSKTGSMARSGISGSRLHLLHLSTTAPSAPLASSFHLDCGKTGAPRAPPLKQSSNPKRAQSDISSAPLNASRLHRSNSYHYVISIFTFSASPFRDFFAAELSIYSGISRYISICDLTTARDAKKAMCGPPRPRKHAGELRE